jgi:PKHD-type hydroxylase
MDGLVHNIYWCWEKALSTEFCRSALEQLDWISAQTATVNPENPVIDTEQRRTDIIWQDSMQPLGCIARAYIDVANQVAGWGYALNNAAISQEMTQVSKYRSENKGHYDWHIDSHPPIGNTQRKLSISILLSDPSEFEGGELQFKGMEDRKILTKQGSIVVFPSFVEHRVTPVTKGVRYSAVTWASGPAFR